MGGFTRGCIIKEVIVDLDTRTSLRKKLEEHLGKEIEDFAALDAFFTKGSVSKNKVFLYACLMTLLQCGKIALLKKDR